MNQGFVRASKNKLMNPFSLHSAVLSLDHEGNPPPCIPYCNRYDDDDDDDD